MKKLLIIFAAVVAAAIGATLYAAVDGKAKIQFAETAYNFGNIAEDAGSVSHTFEFTNQGNANLVIVNATAQCGCTRPEYPKQAIAPGKKGKIKVSFLPKGRAGSFTKVVTITTNGSPSKVRLKIQGTVVPKNK